MKNKSIIKDFPLWKINQRKEGIDKEQKAKEKSDLNKSNAMVAAWGCEESDSDVDNVAFMVWAILIRRKIKKKKNAKLG